MSWIDVPAGSDFPVTNLPYGVFSLAGGPRRVGVAVGDHVLDVSALRPELGAGTLNPFMALGPEAWADTRAEIQSLLAGPERPLVRWSDATMHLPFEVADYVDFYASEQHATNVGRLFRPGSDPLTPNWKHLPIGYHGRAGTVIVSGTPVRRPSGQRRSPDGRPVFGPSEKLDIEAEVGFVVGVPSAGPVGTHAFAEHVFGAVLVNDWSARDIQAWEYVPLGPFLGKSFATSVSPWVVPLAALQEARVWPPAPDPEPLPYLRDVEPWGFDLTLEVRCNGHLVSRPPFAGMYWTAAQQLAHMTVNGATLRTGDLFASGTVSGSSADQRGSFLELAWNGTEPITLPDGSTRSFLADGDTVTITAGAPGADGSRLGFGAVTGRISA